MYDAPRSHYGRFHGLLSSGTIKPFVNHVFSLKNGLEAVKQLETKMTRGKIVICP
jgi:NADPH:quinone reductase-like Zn-dependent oxidoreductase